MISRLAVVAILAVLGSGSTAAFAEPAPAPAETHAALAARIMDAALHDDGAMRKLSELAGHIGHRLSGSPELDLAIAWAQKTLAADGHENVHVEKVMVPHWVRGDEHGEIVAPSRSPLHLLALGGSSSTPPGGLTAPVVVVTDYTQLEALGEAGVRGKIVFYNRVMPADGSPGARYEETVEYRGHGPARAANLGAVAALGRAVTAHDLGGPPTGETDFLPEDRPIPAAAITLADADLLAHLAATGPVSVHLVLGAHLLPDAPSANVIAELRGREHPDEIVLIGAHLDSWDVGQGAEDDGGGCAMVMEALTVLRRLGLRPRRTIRVVLFTNEENGLAGAKAYVAAHAAELSRHVAAIESDSGPFRPVGWNVEVGDAVRPAVLARLTGIAALLGPIGATGVKADEAGADVEEMLDAKVPLLELDVDGSTYFDVHHTAADTLDRIDPKMLARDVAAVAVMAYMLADAPVRVDNQPGK